MRRWIPWIFVLILVGVGGLFLARWVLAKVEAGVQPFSDSASQLSPAATQGAIVSEQRLFDPNLDPQSRESLSEKLEIETRKTNEQAGGAVNPAPKDQLPPVPTAIEQAFANPQAPSGIYAGSDGMVKPEQAQINNYWQGQYKGSAMTVLAGSVPQNEARGLVIVVVSDGFSVTGYQLVYAPDGFNSLKVTEASDTILTLTDLSGKTISFDLDSRTFIP